MVDYKALGGRICRLRRTAGLTQGDLANLVGLSASFLGHIERGTRVLSVETLMAISTALDCTPNVLLGVETTPVPMKQTLPQLLRAMADLLENKQESEF